MGKSTETQARLRQLPAIGKLLQLPTVKTWLRDHPEPLISRVLRQAVEDHRMAITTGAAPDGASEDIILAHAGALLHRAEQPSLRRVINATGIVLHTGLGRAPLPRVALDALLETAAGYSNLELDLDSGQRGKRTSHVSRLLCELTGCEAATVVNNNAAATLLILNTAVGAPALVGRRTRRREVIVSRGQLVEIGGSYRLPDIMKASGARLVEVGTTNRTRLRDYEQAITGHTAALMRVHTSNYRIAGFTEEVPIDELVGLGRKHDLTVIDDLGSGALVDLEALGLRDEPHVADSARSGADAICFSGDKLLGGPQAGIILGHQGFVDAVMANPLMRTYRIDKMTAAALEATLRCYRDPARVAEAIPALAMLSAPADLLQRRAAALADQLREHCPEDRIDVTADVSYAGGGSLPAQALATSTVRWTPRTAAHQVAERLRRGDPAIVTRVHKDAIVFDCRTLNDDELAIIATAVARTAQE